MHAHDVSWEEVKKNKEGTIDLYWNISKPFIYQDDEGNMQGIEAELIKGFKEYLKLTHNVDLTLHWINSNSFKEFYDYISESDHNGEFGVSALSITATRLKKVQFTHPYMSDVAVMISRSDVPIFEDKDHFREYSKNLTAITVEATTYEEQLKYLQGLGYNFKIDYISSNQPIIENILSSENAFGYVDLPLYLMALKNDPTTPIFRQNLYPIKGLGYGLIMPKVSDWATIFNEYLASTYFASIKDEIVGNHIENDIYKIIKNISVGENVNADELIILLTKEKELQNKVLTDRALQNQLNRIINIGFVCLFIGALVVAIFYYRLYRGKKNALEDLEENKKKIEQQQLKIEQANAQLLDMNDEKNNLIRVLAHDLRSPINQIAGLAEIFLIENKKLPEDQKELINQIIKSSMRLREMISKILDAEAVETLQPKIKNEPVSVKQIFEGLKSEYKNSSDKKHIHLNFECDDEVMVLGDAVFIDQILDNLVSNAIKFSNANTSVTLTAKETKDDQVVIKVKDQGPGFTMADQKNMFKKFQRLSAQPTGGEQSTGLGLSIVKMYTELMGGTIDYDSKVGEGTTFTIHLKKA
ncbi:ATP-binding protein [Fulvivirga lutea]|uniref:histidine kinase n=1 Tax=Fulvivirga lutea TaxID=2810512 RepID=A0A974WGB4_9BACT|nr:ATP-binding protein [Fulvivirga lutea]QSE96542.1 transporter substrate-binding domain-containing protein [Fulvivirga lutea]